MDRFLTDKAISVPHKRLSIASEIRMRHWRIQRIAREIRRFHADAKNLDLDNDNAAEMLARRIVETEDLVS